MSNYLAVATVTAALKQMLEGPLRQVVSSADVKIVRPDRNVPTKGVNIFLYQVSPNASMRNADLPTRGPRGELVKRPTAAIDLHYLFTFYGDEPTLEPQLLLGTTVRLLHAQPFITRQLIRDTLASADFKIVLDKSNLADAVDLVKLTPLNLSLEDLSKLWSVFFQTPYALSVSYLASLVLIEGDAAPQAALPVLERRLYALPYRQPTIDAVEPQMIEPALGVQIVLRGSNLLAPDTLARFATSDVAPAAGSTDERLIAPLPADLRAGVNPVRIVQRVAMGATPHEGFESNAAAFILRPKLNPANVEFKKDGAPPDRRVIVSSVAPTVGLRQEVALLLNEINAAPGASPRGFVLKARPRAAEADPLVFGAASVPAATYLVRLRVDSAESLLSVDTDPTHTTFNQFIAPTVTIT